MMEKYNFTGNASFQDAYHDCKLVADSIVDDKSFQNADAGIVLYYMDRILEALGKATPKKAILRAGIFDEFGGKTLSCPNCKRPIINVFRKRGYYEPDYCHFCGQALDWGENDG